MDVLGQTVSIDYRAVAPEIVVGGAACLLIAVDLVARRDPRARVVSGMLALGATVAAFAALLWNLDLFTEDAGLIGFTGRSTLADLYVLDGFAFVFKGLALAVAGAVVIISIPPMRGHRYEGEYYFLFLCSVLGTMLMASSRDLLMLFISLELVSAPAFVIAGLRKRNARSNEAALKFFLIGVLSAGLLVYGISLVYGFTGTTSLVGIAEALAVDPGLGTPKSLLMVGVVFIIGAFGFKISAVPFHFWAPDTYEGSPVPLAAFLSVASKAAGFVGLMLILLIGFSGLSSFWGPVVGAISIATMTVGNVLALRQTHLVRLLGYSSIAQAGYMLIPLAILQPHAGEIATGVNAEAVGALMTYFILYALMNIGAFAVAVGLSKQYPTLLVRDTAGLARRAPVAAMAMAVFLVSLGGIPPFAGWFAKFAVFTSAVNVGTLGLVLAAAMVVNSVVSLYYYVGVVRTMYLDEPEEPGAVRMAPLVTAVVAVCLVGVVVLGVYPEPAARVADAARVMFCC